MSAASVALAILCAMAAPAAAGSWSTMKSMESARAHMGAAALEGEIYVAGGTGILGPLAAFEVYDPKGDYWRPLPPLPEGRQQFGMAAIDGRIVMAGGYKAESLTAESAEMWVYDPHTSQWTMGPPMPAGRAGHALVAAEGRLYAIGGRGEGADRVFVYDLNTRSWTVASFRLPAPRSGLAAAALDGRIYVAGGNSGRLDILDLKTGTWRTGAALPGARAGLAMAAIGNEIHIAGGSSIKEGRSYSGHFSYDPAADRWTARPPMPTPRHSMVSAQVDGRWYVMGGGTGVGFFTVFTDADVVEMYDPLAD